jgi:hypothetical protein
MTITRLIRHLSSSLVAMSLVGCVTSVTDPSDDPAEGTVDEDGVQLGETTQALCKHFTITKYPGNTGIGNRREGQADTHFDICTGVPQNGWGATITATPNNAMLFDFNDYVNESVIITSSGDDREGPYASFTASFRHKNCSPGWVACVISGTYKLHFAAGISRGVPYAAYQGFSAFSGHTVYNTP